MQIFQRSSDAPTATEAKHSLAGGRGRRGRPLPARGSLQGGRQSDGAQAGLFLPGLRAAPRTRHGLRPGPQAPVLHSSPDYALEVAGHLPVVLPAAKQDKILCASRPNPISEFMMRPWVSAQFSKKRQVKPPRGRAGILWFLTAPCAAPGHHGVWL